MPWIGGFSIMKKAPVNKIIPFSNVDGPGNRTAVFFQACSFNCLFCHNPETIHLCNNCGECLLKCPVGALKKNGNGQVTWDRETCIQCDTCIKICPNDASPKVTWMTVSDIMSGISKTAPYISGITTSGGECTLHNECLTDLFTEVNKMGKTCLIDSNGSFDFEKDPRILRVCEGVMLDVKAADPKWHEKLTGHSPDTVLNNLDFLLKENKLFEVRTVIFPERDSENEETVKYVAGRIGDRCSYKIIRYSPFGVRDKYRQILGEDETDLSYAEKYALLATKEGATKAYVV